MKISFRFETLEFQCTFLMRPSKVRKLKIRIRLSPVSICVYLSCCTAFITSLLINDKWKSGNTHNDVKGETRAPRAGNARYFLRAVGRTTSLVVLKFWSWNSMQVLQPTTWEEELSSVWSSLSLVRKKESFRSGVQRAQSTWGVG